MFSLLHLLLEKKRLAYIQLTDDQQCQIFSLNKIAKQLNVSKQPLAAGFSAIQVSEAIVLTKLKNSHRLAACKPIKMTTNITELIKAQSIDICYAPLSAYLL